MADHEKIFGVFPVKGVVVDDPEFDKILFDRQWTLVGAKHTPEMDQLLQSGFKGNLEMLTERLSPDSFLVVTKYLNTNSSLNFLSWNELNEIAESVISALNYLVLTEVQTGLEYSDKNRIKRQLPTPIWISNHPEHCELPIMFDHSRLRSVGHSDKFVWHPLEAVEGQFITNKYIDQCITNSTIETRKLFDNLFVGGVFRNSLRAISRSLQSTSIGQFVAQCFTSMDILTGESEVTRWSELKKLIVELVGHEAESLVIELFDMRDKFVHRHKEPEDMAAHLKCLAVSISALSVFNSLVIKYENPQAVLHVVRACQNIRSAETSSKNVELEKIRNELFTNRTPPSWAMSWLNT